MKLPLHGSNPQYVYEAFDLPFPEAVLDFSVNLNPFGPPYVLQEHWQDCFPLIVDYPDPAGHELCSLIAQQENLPTSSILLGNGGSELITCVANMLAGKRVLIIQPTFSEYENVCRSYGCKVTFIHLTEGEWALDIEMITQHIKHMDALFLCHPNNPTGVVYPDDQLKQLLTACEQHNCLLIIDEAFHDFVEEAPTFADHINVSKHLIIIRSLTKMYAIAGLRLGYVLAHSALIEQLRVYQSYWSVNALALEAGKSCMKDVAHVQRTQTYVTQERQRLFMIFKQLGYFLSDSHVNYYLLRDPTLHEQDELMIWLLTKGLVPRHTYNFPGLDGCWLRFSIKTKEENDMLVEALQQWKEI